MSTNPAKTNPPSAPSDAPQASAPSEPPADPPAPRVVVWSDTAHAPTVRTLLDLMSSEITPVAVGGPPLAGLESLAHAMDLPRGDDIRRLLAGHRADFLLLATHEPPDPADLTDALQRGAWILTLEPIAADLGALAALGPPPGEADRRPERFRGHGQIHFAPAFTQTPGYRHAAEPDDALGPRRLIRFTHTGPPDQGSLAARLVDAWRTVLHFTDLPESIDASLVGPLAAVPDQLTAITGRLAAHARIAGRNTALIELSDRSGLATRELRVLGAHAQLRITDPSYELFHTDGSEIDATPPDAPPDQLQGPPLSHLDLIAQHWRRVLQRPTPGPGTNRQRHAQREAHALACCLACLLSARTGEPETPQHLLDIFQK